MEPFAPLAVSVPGEYGTDIVGTTTTGGGSGSDVGSEVTLETVSELSAELLSEIPGTEDVSEASELIEEGSLESAPELVEAVEASELSSTGMCVVLSAVEIGSAALSSPPPLHPAQSAIESARAAAKSFFKCSGIFPEFLIFILNCPFRKKSGSLITVQLQTSQKQIVIINRAVIFTFASA